jgi:hypothetical protein
MRSLQKNIKGKTNIFYWDGMQTICLQNRKIIDSIHFEEGSYPTFGEKYFSNRSRI